MFLFGAGTLYLMLQIAAVAILRNRKQVLAWACAAVMGLAVLVGLLGGYGDGASAPLWITVALPLASVALALLLLIHLVQYLRRV